MDCKPKCHYCQKPASSRTDFPNCACVGRSLFECDRRPTCPDCQRAHGTLAKFFFSLLNSKQAIRADSVRSKLFSILFDVVCDSRRDLRTVNERAYRECGHAIDVLKNVSIFDDDQRTFQEAIKRALPSLPLSWQFRDEFVKRLNAWDTQRKVDAATQALTSMFDAALAQDKLVKGVAALISEQNFATRLAKIGPQTSDSSLVHQIDKLLAAATA